MKLKVERRGTVNCGGGTLRTANCGGGIPWWFSSSHMLDLRRESVTIRPSVLFSQFHLQRNMEERKDEEEEEENDESILIRVLFHKLWGLKLPTTRPTACPL